MKYYFTILLTIICVNIAQADEDEVMLVPRNQIKHQLLTSHNHFRAIHHAPKLIWDDHLAAYAEDYAKQCKFQHSATPYGENLATGFRSIAIAVNAWYSENKEYSYYHPGFSKSTGHFTQLIWRSTRKLGCGYALCDGKNGTPGKYLVCEYSPVGNVVNRGYFEANVLPI